MNLIKVGALALATLWPVVSAGPAAAGAIKLLANSIPPLSADEGGKAVGPAVELGREMAKAAGIDAQVEIQPNTRVITALDEGDTIVMALVRSAEREARYIWVAEVYLDGLAFATKVPNPPIDSLDAARTLDSVLVVNQGGAEVFLKKSGFTNLSSSNRIGLNAKMLDAGRAPAWFNSVTILKSTWRTENLDPDTLQIGKMIVPVPFWVAASRNIPDDTIRKMRERYEAMKADGTYDRLLSVLK